MHMYMCIYVYTCVYLCIYIYTHTYYVCMHIHMTTGHSVET